MPFCHDDKVDGKKVLKWPLLIFNLKGVVKKNSKCRIPEFCKFNSQREYKV
jgi:hypothetical protein